MVKEYTPTEGIKSTASIAGHPLHPIFIPFPIAFLSGALITDVVYWVSDNIFWADMSFWLIVAGLATGVLAALFGLVDFLTIERARSHAAGWIHGGGNFVVIVLAIINLIIRLDGEATAVLPWGMILSAATGLLLVLTGWYGGELAYRHKVGVVGHNQ